MKSFFSLCLVLTLVTSCGGQEEPRKPSQQEQIGSTKVEERPNFLYKVISRDDWAKSCKAVHLSSTDADFIHLSTEDQLERIIEKYWASASEYVVLKIETAKLSGKLVLEANPGGTNQYYHLYNGSIPLSAIVESKLNKK